MSIQFLEMKYHPAKKEVEFRRFQGDTLIEIDKASRLRKYMNQKGTFVLQDKGSEFFGDIATCFDAERSVKINVITTKNDYEDLEQMVEYYNSSAKGTKIDIALLAELPDMEETFNAVRKHGEDSADIIEKHKSKFFEVIKEKSPELVKECVTNFAREAQKEIDNIRDKIDAMNDNKVNLCFAGVYSAGKSALINAILGYEILPEDISSETARMFRIQSPAKGERVRVVFSILADYSEIIWSEKEQNFIFSAGPVENLIREQIQEEMNRVRGKAQHIQLHDILKKLNTLDDISSEIKVFFKIPLDDENGKVQFTIYDTPGTDSNYEAHENVLKDALSSQTHSILIFVVAPTKLEGEGNTVLLKYLSKLEKNEEKTSIDLGRSLFVMNFADTLLTPESRENLQYKSITSKEDPDISIKLSDKKLFFTAAKYAYAGAAVKNGIADDNQKYMVEDNYTKALRPSTGRYYMLNHCGLSEIATEKQHAASQAALDEAVANSDREEAFYICSGLYALENEIKLYGEKYAAAVRAFAIIDSVDKALNKMNDRAAALKNDNQADIDRVNKEIKNLETELKKAIEDADRKSALPLGQPLPEDVLIFLRLDANSIASAVGDAQDQIGSKLRKWLFNIVGPVLDDPKHKKEIERILKITFEDYVDNYVGKSEELLKKQRDAFKDSVIDAINKNGGVSEEAKRFIADINIPNVTPPDVKEIYNLYDDKVHDSQILVFKAKTIDKKDFLKSVRTELRSITQDLVNDLTEKYRDSHAQLLGRIKGEFETNLKKYSVMMRAKLDDKAAIENLGEKLRAAATELRQCQEKLEEIIWRTNDENGR